MTRRDWLWLCGAPLAGAAREDVGSPEARAAYLRRMLRALCTDLGPRPTGSRAYEAGAKIVERELKRALPRAWREPVPVRRWEPVGAAELRVDGRPLETYLADYSPATPPGGVRGVLRKSGGYEIADAGSGKVLARVGVSEFGRAIVTINAAGELPVFNVGRQDVETLDRAVSAGLPVEARAGATWTEGVKSSNVVGVLPGASRREILIVAHADTKYNTPGAHDNTASLVVMLMLAHAVSGAKLQKTVSFLATTGEEQTFQGAKHRAEVRRREGTLGDVEVCVNLDSLTYGPNLQINTRDAALAKAILDAHREAGVRTQPKVFERDDTMDSAPFLAGGAKTVHLNSRGDDARTLPLWHRPEDTADTIDASFAESSFLVLRELISRLAAARP